MKLRSLLPALTTLLLVTPLLVNAADLRMYYPLDSALTVNLGTAPTAGAVYVGGTPTFGADLQRGLVGNFAGPSYLDTGATAIASAIQSPAYTATAWVNLNGAGTGGDRMIFGTNSGGPLHVGIRGNDIYQGHWGADSSTPIPASMLANNWTQITWTYDGTQRIYANGSLLSSSAQGQYVNGGNQLIGAYPGAEWTGLLDESAVFSRNFSANEVLSMFQLSLQPAQSANFPGQADYLGYTIDQIDQLIDIHEAGSGSVQIGDIVWTYSNTIDLSAPDGLSGSPGDLTLVLNNPLTGPSSGLVGLELVVPEPASLALWGVLGLGFIGVCGAKRWKRRR